MRGNALLFDDVEILDQRVLVCMPRDDADVRDTVVFMTKEEAQLRQLNEYEEMKRRLNPSSNNVIFL